MKNFNKYDNAAGYAADTVRAALADNKVSMIEDTNKIIFEGQNTIVELYAADRGDIIVFDAESLRVKAVKLSTYVADKLPARYKLQDSVYICRRANKHYVIHKNRTAGARWGQGYQVKLLGLDLVNGGSFSFTATCRTAGIGGEVTYSAGSTYADVAALINTALGSAATSNYWKAYVWTNGDNSGVYMEHNDNSGGVLTITASSPEITTEDVTPAKYLLTLSGFQTAFNLIVRNKGISTSYAGCNYDKFLAYYRDNGSATANLAETSNDILKESAFNETDNATLYEKYSGDYEKYIASEMFKYPTGGGVLTDWNDDVSKSLAATMYTNPNGVSSPAYPAAYNVSLIGVATEGLVTGLEVGNWAMPDMDILRRIVAPIPFPLTADFANDSLNKGLSLIGGTSVSPAISYWSSSEYSAAAAWLYIGSGGRCFYTVKYAALPGVAVAVFED